MNASSVSSIGQRLREERKRLALTQAQFGAAMGVSTTTQNNYENNLRSPAADYLAQAAQLGADVLYIVTGQRPGQPAVPSGLTAVEETLLRCRRTCGPDLQRVIDQMAETMASLAKVS